MAARGEDISMVVKVRLDYRRTGQQAETSVGLIGVVASSGEGDKAYKTEKLIPI